MFALFFSLIMAIFLFASVCRSRLLNARTQGLVAKILIEAKRIGRCKAAFRGLFELGI